MRKFIAKFLVAPVSAGLLVVSGTGFAAGFPVNPWVSAPARNVPVVPTSFYNPLPMTPTRNVPAMSASFYTPLPVAPTRAIPTRTFSARVVPTPSAPTKNYIVVLKDGAGFQAVSPQSVAQTHGIPVGKTYTSALRGFTTSLTSTGLATLKADPRVRFISEDRPVSIEGTTLPNGPTLSSPTLSSALYSKGFSATPLPQMVPTGIKRINASPSLSSGAGTVVAVIDTGIDLSHPDLRDNIIANTSCVAGAPTGDDDHGHGSHVAGTIAARNNGIGVVGVAPNAKLVAVKVLNAGGSGSWANVICGIDWVTAHAQQYNIKVANMSLGGWGTSDNNCGITNEDAFHLALCGSAAAGVTYVVAAGNSSSDSAGFVPAAYNDTLITVSALADSDGLAGGTGPATSRGPDDTFASFSNFSASIVDLGGPGVDIYSTFKNGLYHVYSGTSMASPHVAGAAARYIKANPWATTWQQVLAGLKAVAEPLGAGHTDPSGRHPESVVRVNF